MNEIFKKRIKLLILLNKATNSKNLDWEIENPTSVDEFTHRPRADYYVAQASAIVDLGQHTRDTNQGPRQAIFIRMISKSGQEVDFFDEYDFSTDNREKFTTLYELVVRQVKGVDESYDSLLTELTIKSDEIPF